MTLESFLLKTIVVGIVLGILIIIKLNKMNTEIKSILTSKTFWFNVCIIAVGIINMVEGYLQNGTAITLVGVVGVILRSITTQPVSIP
jgi:hypothetical protein